jgi:hypothetical protein
MFFKYVFKGQSDLYVWVIMLDLGKLLTAAAQIQVEPQAVSLNTPCICSSDYNSDMTTIIYVSHTIALQVFWHKIKLSRTIWLNWKIVILIVSMRSKEPTKQNCSSHCWIPLEVTYSWLPVMPSSFLPSFFPSFLPFFLPSLLSFLPFISSLLPSFLYFSFIEFNELSPKLL